MDDKEELEMLRLKEKKRSDAQRKYREKLKQNPKPITEEEKQKKKDYMKAYALKKSAINKELKQQKKDLIGDIKMNINTFTHEELKDKISILIAGTPREPLKDIK